MTNHWGMNVSFVDQGCAKWSWPREAALGLNSENLTPGSPLDNCVISSQLIQPNQVFHLHHARTALLVQVMGLLWTAHLKWSYAVKVLPSLCSGNVGKVLETRPTTAHVTAESGTSQTSSKIEKRGLPGKHGQCVLSPLLWMVRATAACSWPSACRQKAVPDSSLMYFSSSAL